jgi:hypothetical protein
MSCHLSFLTLYDTEILVPTSQAALCWHADSCRPSDEWGHTLLDCAPKLSQPVGAVHHDRRKGRNLDAVSS